MQMRAISLLIRSMCCSIALASAASGFTLYYTGTVFQPYWLIVCNDGAGFISPSGTYSGTAQYAGVVCSGHGGVAYFGDGALESARARISPTDDPSTVTFAEDLGAAGWDPLTPAELDALAQGGGGAAVPLTGYELVSVRIGDEELLASPVTGLPGIGLQEAWSDDDDSGNPVGGSVALPESVPVGPLAPAALALLLTTSGGALALRRTRRA